jgi:hypothetical protein
MCQHRLTRMAAMSRSSESNLRWLKGRLSEAMTTLEWGLSQLYFLSLQCLLSRSITTSLNSCMV